MYIRSIIFVSLSLVSITACAMPKSPNDVSYFQQLVGLFNFKNVFGFNSPTLETLIKASKDHQGYSLTKQVERLLDENTEDNNNKVKGFTAELGMASCCPSSYTN